MLLEHGYGILESQAAESRLFLGKEHKIPGLPALEPESLKLRGATVVPPRREGDPTSL